MYFPLLNHSYFSLLLSTQSPEEIVEVCKENGYKACGLTDYTSLSGSVKFYKACKKAGIKPILGCEIQTENGTVTLLARNLQGWKTLLNIVTFTNHTDNYKSCPCIDLNKLLPLLTSDLIVIDGYYNSVLCNSLFESDECFIAQDIDAVEKLLKPNYEEIISQNISQYSNANSVYYIVDNHDSNNVPLNKVLSRVICSQNHIFEQNAILDGNCTYYLDEGAIDHRVILCSNLKTTFRKLESKIHDRKWFNRFINSSRYFIKTSESAINLGLESEAYLELYNSIEEFDILSPPKFPKFGDNEDELLTQLCREGWKKKLAGTKKINSPKKQQVYVDRIKMELGVIKEAHLAGYFLIEQDFINEFRKRGELINVRGSAGGCLISYLIDISIIDPIEYDLLFERFYDSSRKGSLPDIDADFPPDIRDDVIAYIKNKYGEDNVCQIATFGRLMGRGALKEVLRVNEYCSPTEMDIITDKLPAEASISDLLEDMDEKSVIRWTLENEPDDLKDYCWLDNEGKLQGQYAKAFEQAMRLEGCLKTQGRHAAGVVIATEPISNFCPMVRASRGSDLQAAFEMKDLEAAGGIKYDILGVSALAKLRDTCREWDE